MEWAALISWIVTAGGGFLASGNYTNRRTDTRFAALRWNNEIAAGSGNGVAAELAVADARRTDEARR